jgi:hypothetical protein
MKKDGFVQMIPIQTATKYSYQLLIRSMLSMVVVVGTKRRERNTMISYRYSNVSTLEVRVPYVKVVCVRLCTVNIYPTWHSDLPKKEPIPLGNNYE